MNKKISKIYPYLFAISFIIFVICAMTYIICFREYDTLSKLFVKYDVAKNLPFELDPKEIKLIGTDLMKYLSGKMAFLETKVHINGVFTDFYSLRSKVHMGDVKNIFTNMMRISYICIVVCIVSVLLTLKNLEKPMRYLRHAYIKVYLLFLLLSLVIFIYALTNFDLFFTKFHELLFNNDFWLLDPLKDYIICLLPVEIFKNLGIKILIGTIIVTILPIAYFLLLLKTQLRQEAKRLHENDG